MTINLAGVFQHYRYVVCVTLFLFGGHAGAQYLDDLVLKDVAKYHINDGKFDPGWTEFELMTDYRYKTKEGKIYKVPKGFVVNGASIPHQVWSIIGGPWSGRYRNAAVLHDWLCEETIEDSDYVHRLFYDLMIEDEVDPLKAKTMYIAVKRFGPQWKKSAAFGLEPEVYRPNFDHAEFDALLRQTRDKNLTIEQIDQLLKAKN